MLSSKIATLPEVGGVAIPAVDRGDAAPGERLERPVQLLLDGHQRVSTLIRVLAAGLRAELETSDGPQTATLSAPDPTDGAGPWLFNLAATRQPTRERFRQLQRGQTAKPSEVDLSVILDRFEFNKFLNKPQNQDRAILREGERLRDSLRDFQVPVAVLVADSLEQATQSFKRINSSGTPMSNFHMVAALAYSRDLDLQGEFERLKDEDLAELGWDQLDDNAILRVCAAMIGEDPSRAGEEEIAKGIKANPQAIAKAFRGLRYGAQLLGKVGILGPNALPYIWQMITLAIVLSDYQTDPALAELPAEQAARLEPAARRWFWGTTYGEVFAGVNSAVYKRAKDALVEMIAKGQSDGLATDSVPVVSEVARFDFRSARAKAVTLLLAKLQDGGADSGPAHDALAGKGVAALEPIWPKAGRSKWYNLMVVGDREELKLARGAMRAAIAGAATAEQQRRLEMLGFDVGDGRALEADWLLQQRRHGLLQVEHDVVVGLGMTFEAGWQW
jgi:hypothetical protein